MKKIFVFSAIMAITMLCSCHKDKKPLPDKPEPPVEDTAKQFSYWIVNEDSFSTNNVTTVSGVLRIDLYAQDSINRFGFTFYTGGHQLPTSGTFPIAHDNSENPTYVYPGFYYYNIFYVISPNENSVLSASSVNGKAQYKLLPTWFVDYYNQTDSVLIQGIFNEP